MLLPHDVMSFGEKEDGGGGRLWPLIVTKCCHSNLWLQLPSFVTWYFPFSLTSNKDRVGNEWIHRLLTKLLQSHACVMCNEL